MINLTGRFWICFFENHRPYDLEDTYLNLRWCKGNFTKCTRVFAALTCIVLAVFFPTWCKPRIIQQKDNCSYYIFAQNASVIPRPFTLLHIVALHGSVDARYFLQYLRRHFSCNTHVFCKNIASEYSLFNRIRTYFTRINDFLSIIAWLSGRSIQQCREDDLTLGRLVCPNQAHIYPCSDTNAHYALSDRFPKYAVPLSSMRMRNVFSIHINFVYSVRCIIDNTSYPVCSPNVGGLSILTCTSASLPHSRASSVSWSIVVLRSAASGQRPVRTVALSRRVKLLGRETDLSPPAVMEVDNACSYTFVSPYVFMVWCLSFGVTLHLPLLFLPSPQGEYLVKLYTGYWASNTEPSLFFAITFHALDHVPKQLY
jgi:hypothetical protein